ncbi:MAG: FAD-dependent oxidoreductase [Cyclobacteriaceae bacterium]|nr:FAD-dependent oxidoreductase [Cyclobacteriaceae bacterium]
MDNHISGNHIVAIFGGAVAGSEAAFQLSTKGFRVVVFDQAHLPYGKIEDGLPKWHHKLRDQEEQKIDEKIDHPNVSYVPGVSLGKDVSFEEIRQWGFSAIILATGAWRDRPLPIDGIDDYLGKGLYYQNPFVIWFNHHHEPGYHGPEFRISDNAIVIGGGLASLDVVKILMLETVGDALTKRGIQPDLFEIEKKGIDRTLDTLGLTMDDLGLKGCTLYYRRRAIDMPLSPMPVNTPELLSKAEMVRQKILDNFQKKYLFRFVPCCIPVAKIIDGGQLNGIIFQKTRVGKEGVAPVPGEFLKVEAPLTISSIGSIPEKIDGIPALGNVFSISNPETCLIDGFDNVFAIGNAVTGKGNINESVKHSREISSGIAENFLEWQHREYQEWHRQTTKNVDRDMDRIIDRIGRRQSLPENVSESIGKRIKVLQEKTGYDGNYQNWVRKNIPVRYETLMDSRHEARSIPK